METVRISKVSVESLVEAMSALQATANVDNLNDALQAFFVDVNPGFRELEDALDQAESVH